MLHAGFYVIALFMACWAGSVCYYKLKRIDRLDEGFAVSAPEPAATLTSEA